MSRTVDDRVVSLEFDNKNFESNVKESMSTLDKLKEKLSFKGASDGIEELEKASNKVDFSNLEFGIDKITSKLQYFTQKIVYNFADSVYKAGTNLVRTMTGIDNITTGWSKAESQLVSVQTILSAVSEKINEATGELYSTDDVYDTVEKLSWYADETSYSMDQMTNAIGNFTSTGIDLKVAEQMVMGISNACALAGVNSSKAEHAFLGLSKAIGSGSMTLGVWNNQMRTSGLTNSEKFKQDLIDAAVSVGTLTEAMDGLYYTSEGTAVSISDFTTGLNDAWLTSDVMTSAFTKYSKGMDEVYERYQKLQTEGYTTSQIIAEMREEFEASGQEVELWLKSFEKAQEAVTATQAFESTKEALGSVWSTIFGDMFGTIDKQKQTWTTLANDLYSLFVEPIWSIEDAISSAFGSKWSDFGDSISEYGLEISDFEDQFTSFLKESGVDIDSLTDKYGSLEAAIASGDISTSFIGKFFEKLASGEATVTKVTEDIADLSDAQLEAIGYTEEQIKQFKELAKQAQETGTPLNELIESLSEPSGQDLLADSIHNLCQGIINLKELVGNTWSRAFDTDASNIIYKFVKKINDLTTGFSELTAITTRYTEAGEKLTDEELKAQGYTDNQIKSYKTLSGILTSIVSVTRIITSVIGQLVRGGLKILSTLLGQVNIDVSDLSENLGDSLEDFADWVVESDGIYKALENISDALGKIIDKILEWKDAFMQLDVVQGFIEGFKNTLNNLGSTISGFDLKNLSFENVKDSFTGIADSITSGDLNIFERFGNTIGTMFGNLGTVAVNAKDSFVTAVSEMKTPFGELDIDGQKVLDTLERFIQMGIGMGAGYGILKAINAVANGFSKLLTPLSSLSTLFGAWANTGNSIAGYFKALTANQTANNIVKVAGAISVLALALYVMAKVDAAALFEAVGALALLMGVMAGFTYVMTKMPKMEQGMENLSKIVLSLAASMLILAIALKKMDGLENMWTSLAGVAALLGGLVGACVLLNKYAAGLNTSAKTILALSAAVYIMASAFKALSEISWSGVAKAIIGLTSIVASIAALAAASKLLGSGSINIGINLLAIAVSISLLSTALKKLADLDTETMLKSMTALTSVMLYFVVMFGIIKVAGGAAKESGTLLLGISASLILLSTAVKRLGSLDENVLNRGLVSVAILMTVVAGVMNLYAWASKNMGGIKQAVGLAGVMLTACASMYLLAGAIMVLGNLDKDVLIKGGTTLAAMMVSMGIMMKLMSGLSGFNANSVKGVATTAVMIGVMAASLWVLTTVDPERLRNAVIAMTSVIASVSLMMVALTFVSSVSFGKLLGAVVNMGLLLAELVASLVILDKFVSDPNGLVTKAEALTNILDHLWPAMVVLGIVGGLASFADMASIAGALAIILAECTLVLIALDNLITGDPNELVTKAEAFTKIMEALTIIMVPLTLLGAIAAIAPTILLGMVAIEAVIGASAAIVLLLADKIASFDVETIQKAGDVMEAVGVAIGKLLGGTLVGVLEAGVDSICNSMIKVGEALDTFMTSYESFANKASGLPNNVSTSVKNIAEAIAELGSTATIRSINNLSKNNETFDKLNDVLDKFAEAMINFSVALKKGDFSAAKVNAAANAGKMVASLYDSLPKSGGLLQWFTGTTDMGKFSEDIKLFAKGLVGVAEVLYGKDDAINSSVELANSAGTTLSSLAGSLPKSGTSAYTLLFGEQDLGAFGTQCSSLAQGLVDMASILSGHGEDITNAATLVSGDNGVGTMMSNLAGSIPSTGTLHDFIFGGQNLGTFGDQCKQFASGLVDMAVAISGGSFMDGSTSPGMPTVSADKLQQIKDVCETFTYISNNLPQTGGLEGVFSGSTMTLDTFGQQLSLFAGYFKNFADTLNGVEIQNEVIAQIKTVFEDIDTNIEDNMKIINDDLMSAIEDLFEDATKKIDDSSDDAIDAMDREDDAYDAGINTMDGLISGLTNSEKLSAIYAAGLEAGNTFMRAYKSAMDINSPSRVMDTQAGFTISGLVNGVVKRLGSVRDAGESAASTMLDGVRSAIKYADETVGEDTNPIITPVLDFSMINSQTGQLNNLFGQSGLSINSGRAITAIQNGASNNAISQKPTNVTLNIDFSVNNAGKDLTEADINKFSKQIANRVNEELGLLV